MTDRLAQSRSAELEDECRSRGISQLVHFTASMNLLGILEQMAILSRRRLATVDAECPGLHLMDYLTVNDSHRFDGLLDYISLSVQHPNTYLLELFRERSPEWVDSWSVICLAPKCMWLGESLFSIGNAASAHSKQQGIRSSVDAFRAMFKSRVVVRTSKTERVLTRQGLPHRFPTDVQAEVLIRSSIPVEEIQRICFETERELRHWRGALAVMGFSGMLPLAVDPSLFRKRDR